MADSIFIISTVAAFQATGIDLGSSRRSIDGKEIVVHWELLKDEQILALVKMGELQSLHYDETLKLMSTKEWSVEEHEHNHHNHNIDI